MKQLESIASLQNNYIKLLKKLTNKKYRLEYKKFTVENLKIIIDALKDSYDFETLFVSSDFINRHPESFEFIKDKSRASYRIVDDKIFSHFSQLDTPAGIIAIYKIPEMKKITNDSVIYLNNISDPGNLGTILRTALAFNFTNIVLDSNCVDLYNSKTISAAKNSIFNLNIFEDSDGSWILNNKLPVYITSSHGGTDLNDFKSDDKFCLVLGNESSGVSQAIEDLADRKIEINISDNIESLNVSVAAAILFYKLQKNHF
jgi:TrmH family RNA methyltransferase